MVFLILLARWKVASRDRQILHYDYTITDHARFKDSWLQEQVIYRRLELYSVQYPSCLTCCWTSWFVFAHSIYQTVSFNGLSIDLSVVILFINFFILPSNNILSPSPNRYEVEHFSATLSYLSLTKKKSTQSVQLCDNHETTLSAKAMPSAAHYRWFRRHWRPYCS